MGVTRVWPRLLHFACLLSGDISGITMIGWGPPPPLHGHTLCCCLLLLLDVSASPIIYFASASPFTNTSAVWCEDHVYKIDHFILKDTWHTICFLQELLIDAVTQPHGYLLSSLVSHNSGYPATHPPPAASHKTQLNANIMRQKRSFILCVHLSTTS